ncbi:ABC transporter ATP-binding protein [Ruegeria sp.]|uniref:ABC transporter ATP-binding protein n=1 Tax=Ruegeria sp. TaxID=1879320 RepID=UPI003AFFD300
MTWRQRTKSPDPIQIRALAKRYDSDFALKSFDLDVQGGEFLTVLGPSGSGKTTLLMAIAGFIRPDSGSIKFGADEVVLMPPHRRDVGVVFQNHALFPHMTVAENIAFPLKMRGIGKSQRKAQVEDALDMVQLSGFGQRRIDELSGGQSQRVALARAVVFQPRVVLMDEPLSALDRKLRESMQFELKRLHHTLGFTTIYVTHDQREALTMSDRIAVVNSGELVQLGTPEEVYNQPKNAFVANFVGESAMIPLVKESSGNLTYNEQIIGRTEINAGDPDWFLVVRPEKLFPLQRDDQVSDQTIVFQGTIYDSFFEGGSNALVVEIDHLANIRVKLDTPSGANRKEVQIGHRVSFGLHRKDVVIVPRE